MKKTKILPLVSIAATGGVIAPVVTLASCGPKGEVSHVEEPKAEDKTVELIAGEKKGSYKITLKEEAETADIQVEAITPTNNEAVEVSNVNVTEKLLTFDVAFSGDLHDTGTATATFNIKVKNTKSSWEQTISGYSLKFTSKAITEITLTSSEMELEWKEASAGHITFQGHEPITAKVDHYVYTSADPESVSVTTDGYITVNKLFKNSINIEVYAVDSFGNESEKVNCAIKAKNTIEDVKYVKGSRYIDSDNSKQYTFTVEDSKGRDQTEACEWSVDPSTAGVFDGNKFTPNATTKTVSAKIYANVVGEPAKISDAFDIEIASFSKVDADKLAQGELARVSTETTATITGNLILPSRYYDEDSAAWLPLSSINASAFAGGTNDTLDLLYIPSTIDYVGNQAFLNANISSIVVDSANTKFSSGSGCNCIMALDDDQEPESVILGCANTTNLPTTVYEIGASAFAGIQFDYTSPATGPKFSFSNITAIRTNAFLNSNIQTLSGLGNVTVINSYAFQNCTSLSSVTFPDSLTEIQRNAFNGCTSLQTVNIPTKVDTIGQEAFLNSGLTTLTFSTPDTQNLKIEASAFKGTSLTSVTLPSNVVEIGIGAFNITTLTELAFPNTTDQWGIATKESTDSYIWIPSATASDNADVFKSGGKFCSCFSVNYGTNFVASGLKSGQIKASSTSFSGDLIAYSNYKNGSADDVPLTTISWEGFKGSGVVYVDTTYSSKLTLINSYAFQNCTNLTQVKLGKSLAPDGSLAAYIFKDCSNLAIIDLTDFGADLPAWTSANTSAAFMEINKSGGLGTIKVAKGTYQAWYNLFVTERHVWNNFYDYYKLVEA